MFKQLPPKKCEYECNFLITRHKITQDGMTCHQNHSCFEFSKINMLKYAPGSYITIKFDGNSSSKVRLMTRKT